MLPAMTEPQPHAPAARSALDLPEPPVAPRASPSVKDEERALCERVAAGDEVAFAKLVERYQDRIYGFCARMLSDRAEAEDIAQDVFLTLYKNAGEFRGESAFSTWLFRIAKNQTLNRIKYLERRGRSARRADAEGADARIARLVDPDAARADDAIADRQQARLVQEAIGELAEEHRAVVVLRDLEDLSYEEISEITGLPLGTVKSRIHRARSALAKRLSRLFR